MSIKLTIRNQGDNKGGHEVAIPGEGAIDTQAEAQAALDAAGVAAAGSEYLVEGFKPRTYAQMVGFLQPSKVFAAEGGVFHPEGTTYDSASNEILRHPALYDSRPQADGSPLVIEGGLPRIPNTALDASTLFSGSNALPQGAVISRVEVTHTGAVTHRGNGAQVPATALAMPGHYMIRIFYRTSGMRADLYRDVRVTIRLPKPPAAPKEIPLAPPVASAPLAGAPRPSPAAPSVAPGRLRPSRRKRGGHGKVRTGSSAHTPRGTPRMAGSHAQAGKGVSHRAGTARKHATTGTRHPSATGKHPGQRRTDRAKRLNRK